jgi:hypothetical protein
MHAELPFLDLPAVAQKETRGCAPSLHRPVLQASGDHPMNSLGVLRFCFSIKKGVKFSQLNVLDASLFIRLRSSSTRNTQTSVDRPPLLAHSGNLLFLFYCGLSFGFYFLYYYVPFAIYAYLAHFVLARFC